MEKLFPGEEIIITQYFDVHQDWEVPIVGFFIVSAKRKLRSVADFTEAEAEEFIRLVMALRRGMTEVLNIKDVYLFQNEDTAHNFHLWIFPRHAWMESFGRKIESVRPILQHAKVNMLDEENFRNVRQAVKLLKEYMKSFK